MRVQSSSRTSPCQGEGTGANPVTRSRNTTMINVLLKIRNGIRYRVDNSRPGLYLYILFPIALSFLATFTLVRVFNYLLPNLYIPWSSGFTNNLHIHHFAYGIFILAASGYLALVHDTPRAKYLICWLYGLGLGLALDELGIWLKFADSDAARWNYDGLTIFSAFIVMILSAKPGVKLIKNIWPFD